MGFRLYGENTSGNAIKQVIVNTISELGLSIEQCRSQSFDGVWNMAGKYVGA